MTNHLVAGATALSSDRQDASGGVFELRQYSLHPGRRDELIALFEREFVESQEALGIVLPGMFVDLDNSSRFVWFRGFRDMEARLSALTAFYGGPIWAAHRQAANATMIDSDNVLLLRPHQLSNDFPRHFASRANTSPQSTFSILVTVYSLQPAAAEHFPALFDKVVNPDLVRSGAQLLGTFLTDDSKNTFPRLPVREGEQVFVCVARFDNVPAVDEYLNDNRTRSSQSALDNSLSGIPHQLRLQPTRRSSLR